MIPDGAAATAPSFPELDDIALFTAREGHDTEAGDGFIPKEFSVLAGWAGQGVNRSF